MKVRKFRKRVTSRNKLRAVKLYRSTLNRDGIFYLAWPHTYAIPPRTGADGVTVKSSKFRNVDATRMKNGRGALLIARYISRLAVGSSCSRSRSAVGEKRPMS